MKFMQADRRIFRAAILAAGLLSNSGCGAQPSNVPAEWKTDCVGRMQVSFPGDVDVSASTLEDLKKSSWQPPPSSFTDGQSAWGGNGLQFLGSINVLHGLSGESQKAYLSYRAKIREEFRADVELAKAQNKPYQPFIDYPVLPTQEGFGFEAQGQRLLVLRSGTEVFLWEGNTGIAEAEAQRRYDVLLRGLQVRPTFHVPREPGVCLPYTFVRDDGSNGRYIAMTYRLKAQPDITIYLKDMDASKAGSGQNSAKFTAKYMSDFFWSNNYGPSMRKSATSYWPDGYRNTTLASQPAVESFVRLIRNDDSEDFGYLVVSKGDPDAKEDMPDLMLYVIRDGKNARFKGIEPMGKETFLLMARTIAASVKRRPVQ